MSIVDNATVTFTLRFRLHFKPCIFKRNNVVSNYGEKSNYPYNRYLPTSDDKEKKLIASNEVIR